MTQPTLWEKIEAYYIGPDKTPMAFSEALAQTARINKIMSGVVEYEYKRFMYLCAVQDQPVTPTTLIEKAWLLHLSYSKDYWEEFCPNILEKKVHHPTGDEMGSADMKANFEFTQKLYEEEFGEPMPERIWLADQMTDQKARSVRLKFRWASLFILILISVLLYPFVNTAPLLAIAAVLAIAIVMISAPSNQKFFNHWDFKMPRLNKPFDDDLADFDGFSSDQDHSSN